MPPYNTTFHLAQNVSQNSNTPNFAIFTIVLCLSFQKWWKALVCYVKVQWNPDTPESIYMYVCMITIVESRFPFDRGVHLANPADKDIPRGVSAVFPVISCYVRQFWMKIARRSVKQLTISHVSVPSRALSISQKEDTIVIYDLHRNDFPFPHKTNADRRYAAQT